MKTIEITTRRAANRILTDSLFHPINGKTLSVIKYDGGKYKVNPETPYIGRKIEVADCIHAVYTVRSKDADGPYVKLMCIYEV